MRRSGIWWASDRWQVYRAKCAHCGSWPVSNEHAGFNASKLLSPWTGRDGPIALAKKWLAAKDDPARRQVFENTQLAKVYRRHSGKELKLEQLLARREHWICEVPDGVAAITVGVDVQDYRVEMEIVGWGRDEESWSLCYLVIDGQFSDPEVQNQVDNVLKRVWSRADGRGFAASATCIDSGGHHTQDVYKFAQARLGRRVFAIKGESAQQGQRNPVWPVKRPTSRTKKSFRPVIIGVNAAKDVIRDSLLKETEGPRYMHFNQDRDVGYFEQLTAERLTLKVIGARKFTEWKLPEGRANEALDCRVYAYAALCSLAFYGMSLNRRANEVGAVVTRRGDGEAAPVEPAETPPEAASIVISPGRPDPPKKSIVSRLA